MGGGGGGGGGVEWGWGGSGGGVGWQRGGASRRCSAAARLSKPAARLDSANRRRPPCCLQLASTARRGWRVVSHAALREQRLRRAFYFPSPTSQVVYFERADPNGRLTKKRDRQTNRQTNTQTRVPMGARPFRTNGHLEEPAAAGTRPRVGGLRDKLRRPPPQKGVLMKPPTITPPLHTHQRRGLGSHSPEYNLTLVEYN